VQEASEALGARAAEGTEENGAAVIENGKRASDAQY
jgi:hypothetical protein